MYREYDYHERAGNSIRADEALPLLEGNPAGSFQCVYRIREYTFSGLGINSPA